MHDDLLPHRTARRVLEVVHLVEHGDTVSAQDIVAETSLPGDITPINLANALSMPPGDVPARALAQGRRDDGILFVALEGGEGIYRSGHGGAKWESRPPIPSPSP